MTRPANTITTLAVVSLLLTTTACGGEESSDIPASTGAATSALTTGGGAAVALGAPSSLELAKLKSQLSKVTEAAARTSLEKGLAGAAAVKTPSCATVKWSGNLSGTVTFKDCTTRQGGKKLNGTVGVAVTLPPKLGFTLTLTQLEVDGTAVSGTLTVTPSGAAGATVTGNLAYSSADGATSVSFSSLSMSITPAAVTLSGSGAIKSASLDSTFTASNITWKSSDCLPTSGSVTYTDGGATVVVTFLATTPQTGEVQVQVGSLPARTVALLPPCNR